MAKKTIEAEAVEKPKSDTGLLVRICVAAWLIPGCGHLMLGRKGRAFILFGAIIAMFLLGLAMQGEFFAMHSSSYLQRLGFLGEMCVGVAMPTAMFFGYPGGDQYFVSSDYGTAFLVAAGMLNVLTVLDAYDIAMGRKP
ncbi:MAG: DUF6677 family protein [Terriglobia bacterium]